MRKLIAAIGCGLALAAGAIDSTTYLYSGTSENGQFRQYGYFGGELFAVSNATQQFVSPVGLFRRQASVTNEFTVTPPTGYALSEWVLAELKTGMGLPLPQKLSDVVRAATWRTETVSIPGSGVQFEHLWNYMILAPCFEWIRYDLVYRMNDGTSAATRTACRYPDRVTVAEPTPRTGYAFQGWAMEPKGTVRYTPGQILGATDFGVTRNAESIELYAIWDKEDLTVTLDACGGSVAAASVTARVGEPLSLPTPVRAGYDFLGWFTAAEGGVRITDGMPMTVDIANLFAQWRVAKCVLVFGTANPRNGFISPTGERSYESGEEVSFSATPSTGYRFAGWSDGSTAASRTVIVSSNATYWARFEPKVHTVTFVYRTATGEEATDVQQVKDGAQAWPPADALCKNWAGHTFAGWSGVFDSITSDRTVTARYTTDTTTASIYYLANGGTGEMQPQVYDRSQPTVLLQENGFTRDGATFLGWSTDPLAATNAVMFADGAVLTDPAPDGQVSLFAVWALPPPESATIHFCANGGSGWMEPLTITNAEPTTLPPCTFASEQAVFLGWARTLDATSVDYADGATVPVVPEENWVLYAVWQEKTISPLAAAVGASFDLVSVPASAWIVTDEVPHADTVDFTTCLTVAEDVEGSVKLTGQVNGPGVLTFVGFSEGCDNWFLAKSETESLWTTVTELPQEGGWFTNSVTWTATKQMKMQWERRESGALWIASVTWTPDQQTEPIRYAHYLVTPRVAIDGHCQTGVAALAGCTVSGDASATLPGSYTATVTLAEGYVWPDGGTEPMREVVWEMKPGAATAASWHVREDLFYTGGVQTGVVAVAGCTVTSQTATDAGIYQAVATLLPGGYWSDGTTTQSRLVSWSIAKATYDMSAVRFSNETVVADGSPKRLPISGALPDGVSVTYDGNDKTEPGTYTVTARFTGDAVNYEPIPDLSATLTIETPFGPSNRFEPVWEELPVGAVSFFDQEVVYDGQPHTIDTNALLAAFAPYVPQPIQLEFAESTYSSSWSATPVMQTDAGRCSLVYRVATADAGYFTHEAQIVVLPRALDAATDVTVADQRWTDQPLTPPVSVSVEGQSLLAGRDFTVAFINNDAVGMAVVIVTGCGNYTGACTATFRINRAVYDMSGVRFADATVLADGQPKSLAISGTLPAGVSVTYSGNGQTAPGVYTVTAHFTGDTATHEPIPDLSAVLTIRDRLRPNGPVEDGLTLYPTDHAAPMDASYTATFSGWLRDANGALAGLISVKTTKAVAGKPCKSTIAVTWLETGKKKFYSTTVNPSADDGYPQDEFGLIYTDRAIFGSFQGYAVEMSEEFFRSSKDDEKELTADLPQGNWTAVLTDGEDGYAPFTLTVARKGKAKVVGYLSDGTRIAVTVQGVLGEDGRFAVPVLYAKKNVRCGLVFWLVDGELTAATLPPEWTFLAGAPLAPLADGAHQVRVEMPAGQDYLTMVDGVALLPKTFTVAGKKWSAGSRVGLVRMDKVSGQPYLDVRGNRFPSNLALLRMTYTARTGEVKGTCKFYYVSAGRIKCETAVITGAVVEGRLFATGVIKKTAASFRIESE